MLQVQQITAVSLPSSLCRAPRTFSSGIITAEDIEHSTGLERYVLMSCLLAGRQMANLVFSRLVAYLVQARVGSCQGGKRHVSGGLVCNCLTHVCQNAALIYARISHVSTLRWPGQEFKQQSCTALTCIRCIRSHQHTTQQYIQ